MKMKRYLFGCDPCGYVAFGGIEYFTTPGIGMILIYPTNNKLEEIPFVNDRRDVYDNRLGHSGSQHIIRICMFVTEVRS